MSEQHSYELYHYGIKGMKWGIRRTAAQLGHLVGKGAKKAKGAIDRRRADKRAEKLRKKPLSKLTDSELEEMTARLKKEKAVFDLQQQMSSINESKASLGKRFVSSLGKDVIAPAAIHAGKEVLERWLKKQGYDIAGLKDTQYGITKLMKEEAEAVSRNNKAKKDKETEIINDWFKKRQEEAKDKATKDKVDKEVEETINKAEKKAEKSKAKMEKEAKKAKEREEREANKVYEGEVSGEGTSKSKKEESSDKKRKGYYNPINVDFTVEDDTPVSAARESSAYRSGELFVQRLLLGDGSSRNELIPYRR